METSKKMECLGITVASQLIVCPVAVNTMLQCIDYYNISIYLHIHMHNKERVFCESIQA